MADHERDLYRNYMAFMSTLVLISLAGMAVAVFVAAKASRRTGQQERTIEIIEGQYGDLRRENEAIRERLQSLENVGADNQSAAFDCGVENLDQNDKIQDLSDDIDSIVEGLKDEAWIDPHRC